MNVLKEIRLASRLATDFQSPAALKKYLQDHPKADKSKHRVVQKSPSGTPSKAPGKKTEVPRHRKVTPSVRSLKKVDNVMKAHKLTSESDEVSELMGFKKTLGQRVPESKQGQYYVRNEAKLKADFIKNMNPANYDSPEAFRKAKARMQAMPTGDFGKILAAVSEEEEPVQASTEKTMNRIAVAQHLIAAAKELALAGEVPEAFKKEWKNKDKDNDGKENEPKPDFLKKKSSLEEFVAGELVKVSRYLIEAGEVPEAFKKQWDKGGKKDDKKDNKPPWLKKKKSSVEEVAEALISMSKALLADEKSTT
jgi:hypothetical protein